MPSRRLPSHARLQELHRLHRGREVPRQGPALRCLSGQLGRRGCCPHAGISSTMLRNRVTALNWAGIVVAFAGVLGYSLSP